MSSNYIITSSGNFMDANELYHWGIKGMKWGVRRYQNSDGSLTAAGRKRYTNSDGTLNKKGEKYFAKESERLKSERKKLVNQKHTAEKLGKLDAKRKANEELKKKLDPKKEETPKKKSIGEMTDEELNAAINRARMENTYKQLRPEPVSKEAKRAEFMNKMLNDVIVPSAINAGKNALNKMIEKAMKDKVDPDSYEALKKTYDKLKIKRDIEKLKNGKDSEPELNSWDDWTKREQYRKAKRENDEAEAAKKAKQAKQESSHSKFDANGTSKENKTSDNSTSNSRSKSNAAGSVWDRINANKKAENKTKQDFVNEQKKRQKAYDFDYSTAKSGKVEGTGTSFNKKTDNSSSSNSSRSTIDMERGSDGVYRYGNTSVTDLATTRNTSSGSSMVSRYSNIPIAGLLPDPKDRDH